MSQGEEVDTPVLSIRLLEDPPREVEAGGLFSIWWEIWAEEELKIPFTAVLYDTVSHPGDLTGMAPEGSGYRYKKGVIGPGPYYVPDEYEAFFRMDEPGKVYFRVVAGYGGRYYWTDEFVVEVTEKGSEPPKNRILDASWISAAGEEIPIRWGIRPEIPGRVESSRVYFDNGSSPGNISAWQTLEGHKKGDAFEAVIPPQEKGFLYLRTLIEADGREYWSDEGVVTILEEGRPVRVLLQNWSYNPERFHVPEGTSVVWVNLDNEPHHPSFADGFEGTVFVNSTFNRTFSERGTYLYFDYVVPGFEGYVYVE
jgi:plastocyanin